MDVPPPPAPNAVEVVSSSPAASPSLPFDPPIRRSTADARIALAFLLAYVLAQVATARLRITDPFALGLISLPSLVCTLGLCTFFARALRSRSSQILAVILLCAVVLPFMIVPFLRPHTVQQLAVLRAVFSFYKSLFRAAPGLRGVLMIALAAALGALLSRLVRELKILLPMAVVLALVDLYVVFGGGLVSQAHRGETPVGRTAQVAMQSLTVSLTPRPSAAAAPAPLAVGFADYLFVSLFFAAFVRFDVPYRRTFVLLCGTLCLYLGLVVAAHLDLPALVPISVVVIGSNFRSFRYERAEAFAMLYAGLIVAAVLGILVYFANR